MANSLIAQFDRVKELISELETEYDKCLDSKEVSDKAKVITHEVIEKLSNILDQIARNLWKRYLIPTLSKSDKKKAIIYFPKSNNRYSFNSIIGRWMVKDLEKVNKKLFDFLISKQPFLNKENDWLSILGKLASQKHIGLVPQKRQEITHIRYSSPAGTVHFIAEQVKFGPGVSILGAPVNPNTQRIIPTQGVLEKIEKWISFVFEGYNLDALDFCKKSLIKVKGIFEEADKI